VASGAGENGRHSVGTTVFGGMIMSTVLNLFFIPALYLLIEGLRERRSQAKAKGSVSGPAPHPVA
jgi:HAE1 family hydrophobic/amphiphilic exporter-1